VGEESIFTVQDLARYLRMRPLTIYKHVSSGKLPGFKVGSHWRFKKESIDRWIRAQEDTNLDRKTLINQ
jgi:excisionase family DNA binding protein